MRSTLLIALAACSLVACPDNDNPLLPANDAGTQLDTGRADVDAGAVDVPTGDTLDAAADAVADGADGDASADADAAVESPLACHFAAAAETICYDCIEAACGTLMNNAYGVSAVPDVPGGACDAYLGCLSGCACDDASCRSACEDGRLQICVAALDALNTCAQSSCLGSCGNPPHPDCGNGLVEPGEQCDGSALGDADCAGVGYDGGELGCRSDCTFDGSACEGELDLCGNEQLDINEDCDGAIEGTFCETLGYGAGTLGCTADCGYDVTACEGDPLTGLDVWFDVGSAPVGCPECQLESCGNDFNNAFGSREVPTEPGGACDDLMSCLVGCRFDDSDCVSTCESEEIAGACADAIGDFEACVAVSCDETCTVETSVCGNEVVESGELCDTILPLTFDCTALGYDAGALDCTGGCEFDEAACEGERGSCGDGTVNPGLGEHCDGTGEALPYCRDLGWDTGLVMCSDGCAYDFGECGTQLTREGGTCATPLDLEALATVEGGVYTLTETTTGALDERWSEDCGGRPGREVVFAWIPPFDGSVTVDVAPADDGGVPSFDPLVYVRTSCDEQATEIVCNDDVGASTSPNVGFDVTGFSLYYIVVDGSDIQQDGEFELTLNYEPLPEGEVEE